MSSDALESLRFPVGRFVVKKDATAADRAQWFGAIERAPAELAAAVAGLSTDQFSTPYRDGGWTVAQVIHHVADSHLNAYARCRWVLTEPNFTVKPYDEKAWANLTDARGTDVTPSLDLLRGLHVRWVTLLRSLDAREFARELHHPERGPMTLDSLVQLYAWHGHHHAAHILALRKRHGW